jgi:hypothetical protein
MNCEGIRELLSGHLDRELSSQQENLVTQHLTSCDHCTDEFAACSAIGQVAKSLPSPKPPADVWDRLERQLDQERPAEITPRVLRTPWNTYRILAVAATLLITVGVFTWLFQPFGGHHNQMAHFGRFMEAFPAEPGTAQQTLLASYSGRAVTAQEMTDVLKYTPVGIGNAPVGYSVEQSYLLNMPCCRCSQVVYRRDRGGFLALFEHDTTEQPNLFGDCPCVDTVCNGNPCTLVQTENHITASCEVGGRHFTIVGAGNIEEVQTFVAWLEGETQAKNARS